VSPEVPPVVAAPLEASFVSPDPVDGMPLVELALSPSSPNESLAPPFAQPTTEPWT
jgi:hypothetical protein